MGFKGLSFVSEFGLSYSSSSFIKVKETFYSDSLLVFLLAFLFSLATLPAYSINTIAPEICDNGIDDDGDGLIDCADPDCTYFLTASSDVPLSILASIPNTVNSTLTVSTVGTITDINIKGLDISHTYIRDLRINLIGPDGTSVTVLNRPCNNDDDINMELDDEAASNNFPCPPTDGLDYQPDNPLSAFIGKEMNGTWTLEVNDVFSDDGGTINAWQLEFFFACAIEICDNGIDDDGDGLIDSNDPDCCGSLSSLSKNNWSLQYFDSEELVGEDGAAINAIDDDVNTFWHTEWFNTDEPLPHEIQIDLGANYNIGGFQYLPRQTGVNGRIGDYEFYLSTDGVFWGSPKVSGNWTYSDFSAKEVLFATTAARYVRLRATSEASGEVWTSMAELYVLACSTTEICDNGIDEDLDGATDCDDNDCTVADAGTILGDESNCGAFTPVEIASVSEGTTGISSSIQYRWQESTDTLSANWVDLNVEDTLSTYQPPGISQPTFYRRKATTAHCADSLFTNAASKVVDENVTDGGTIGYDESVIGPYDPAAIVSIGDPSGGSGSIEYAWYSYTSTTWNLIAGATSNSYDPPLISQNTQYRRFARIIGCNGDPGCCGSTWLKSNIVLKEVISGLDGGGVIGLMDNPAETGQGNVVEELSQPIGLMDKQAIYQWEYSDDGNKWTDLYGAIADDLPACRFEKHKYFRRKVKNVDFMPWEYSNVVEFDGTDLVEVVQTKEPQENACTLTAKIFLEGAKGKEALMRDDLRAKGLLPFYSPYMDLSNFQSIRIPGHVFQKTGDKAVVDWVNLELYASLEERNPVYARPALLLRDGSICDLDGQSPVAFWGSSKKKFHLLIRHRNHEPLVSKKYRFESGKAITIKEFYTVTMDRLGQESDTMLSSIRFMENLCSSGNGMAKGYEFHDFNMDGVAIPAGPGNELGQFLKHFH